MLRIRVERLRPFTHRQRGRSGMHDPRLVMVVAMGSPEGIPTPRTEAGVAGLAALRSEPERAVVARTRTGVTATIYLGKTEDGSKQLYARSFDPNRTDVFLLSEADSTRLIKDLKSFTK